MSVLMLKKISLYILFFSLPLFLCAQEEIEISLRTRQTLAPLYLSKLASEKTDLPQSYLAEIYSIISFDCRQSGYVYLLSEDSEKEEQLALDEERAFDPNFWNKTNAKIAVKLKLSGSVLQIAVFHKAEQKTFHFSSPNLLGDLSADRPKIHKLLSQMQKELFGVEGIFHKKILYSMRTKISESAGPKWISEIWSCDFDGKNVQQLTQEKGYCISPRFIPKRPQNFVYVSYKLGQSKIFLGSLGDKEGIHFIPLPGNQLLPSISPASDHLAFICDAAGRPDLFIQDFQANGDLSGKPKQLFSFPRATQASPTFSPDGKTIAFVSDKDGPPRIYSLTIPASADQERPQARLITKKNRQNTSPCWSPDGTKLAYSAKTDDVRQIWIYDFAKEEEWQLTFAAENMENPVWAADSMHLLFNSEGDSCELYMANIHQPEPVKISEGAGQKRFPAWEH